VSRVLRWNGNMLLAMQGTAQRSTLSLFHSI
jgi:hypothetical protein